MSKTIVINRELSKAERDEVLRMNAAGANVYTLPGAQKLEFARAIGLDAESKKALNYSAMAEVLALGDLRIGQESISGLFRIGTASCWHYHKFRIYFAFRNLRYFLKPLEMNFSGFQDHIWFVSAEQKPLVNLYPEVDFRFQASGTKAGLNFGDLFRYLLLLKFRILANFFKGRKKPEYLLYLTEKYSNVLDRKSLKIKQGHHILEYLIGELDERFALLTEVLMPKPRGKSDFSFSSRQFQTHWSKTPKIFLEAILLNGFLKSGVRRSINQAHRQLKNAYSLVENSPLSSDQKLIFSLFKSLDSSTVFFLTRYFSARDYFAKSGIKAVVAADENSPLTKSVLDAARFHGVKIIGLQHGTMHDLHPAYRYTPADRDQKVMPDLTLSWGNYWKDFLYEKGNYPEGSLVTVGQIRTDIVPVLLEKERLKTDDSIFRVVFASQPQRDPELRYQAAFDVFAATAEIQQARLTVKLHPREYADSEYYRAIAVEAGCTNYTLDTSSDLYQLIASSDAIITCFSTVGTETIYFGKPLIILDHLQQDIMSYVAEGVAFQAVDSSGLVQILNGIHRGELKIDRKKYDLFISKYAFRIDGKVAERCISAITSAG